MIQSIMTYSAEKIAKTERLQRPSAERQASGPRAEFWKLRGLRGQKKNDKNRRSRDDLLQLTIQGNYPAYERVLLREGEEQLFYFVRKTLALIRNSKLTQQVLTRMKCLFCAANFKRPVVILGPLNDIAMEKLTREMPDDFEAAGNLLFF